MSFVRRAFTAASIILVCGMGAILAPAKTVPDVKLPALTTAEEKAVSDCLTIIRGCQLQDGAIVQMSNGGGPDAPVWVAPYFADYAALALIAEYERKRTSADLKRVGQWINWCVKNQEDKGYWYDFEGTAARYRNNGKVDAWDSSAALFLLVVGRYHRSGGMATPKIVAAAEKALSCIEAVSDEDGLTWATPTYKVKYLMDNIEVYAGLRAGSEFFLAANVKDKARKASDQADRIGKKLLNYWMTDEKVFAYALHQNGVFEFGLDKAYPHGLAQLFGVAFVAPKAEAWTAVGKFSAEVGPAAATGTERWLIAASRLGGKDAREWRTKTVEDVTGFTRGNVYVYRPAVAVLGLLEGADWMPNIAGHRSLT